MIQEMFVNGMMHELQRLLVGGGMMIMVALTVIGAATVVYGLARSLRA